MNTREATTTTPFLRTILIATGLLASVIFLALSFAAPQAASGDDAECDNEEFRTGPSAYLPDCRAYEQVSPVQKYGQTVWDSMPVAVATSGVGGPRQGWASADGQRLIYTTSIGAQATDPTRGFGSYPQAAHRTEDGWTASVIPGEIQPETDHTQGSVQHLHMLPNRARTGMLFYSQALLTPEQPYGEQASSQGVFFAEGGERGIWLSRPPWEGAVPALDSPEFRAGAGAATAPVGQSDDGSTFYFMSQQLMTLGDASSGREWPEVWALYRWKDGVVTNAGVLPDGTLDAAGSMSPGLTLMQGGQWTNASGTNRNTQSAVLGGSNVVSRDGKRALFLGLGSGDFPDRVAQLYLYREGQSSLLLSKPTGEDEPIADSRGVAAIGAYNSTGNNIDHNANGTTTLNSFADEDLDVILFSTQDALTDDAPTATTVIKTYRYTVDGDDGELEYLSDLDRPWASSASPVRNPGNVFRMSDDGSRIFFWTPAGELKLWRDGESTLTLATGLETSGLISTRNARFSDDGRTVVFGSIRAIGGEPNHPAGNTALQTQVYRFEEGVDTAPQCISCPPADAATKGPAAMDIVTPSYPTGFGAIGNQSPAAQTRVISSDGRRVYFTTTSTLDPRDQNARADVYEWSADREGNGIALISSGAASSNGAGLLDVDASGDNVFFVTEDALTASDADDISDTYVARVGGGLPDPAPFDMEEGCSADTCQGGSSDSPATPPVGSVDFTGKGNPEEPRNPASIAARLLRSANGAAARLRVRVPDAGQIAVRGPRIRGISRSVPGAGNYTVAIRLTPKARKALRKQGRLRTRARVVYRPDEGERATKNVPITFTKPKPKRAENNRGSR